MVFYNFFSLLLLTASSLAITVTSPSQETVWSSSGSHTVKWFEVSTDPTVFAITLVQQGVFRMHLANKVDGTKNYLNINAELPTGDNYQVNIVKSPGETNTILAQSAPFRIV